MFDNLLQISIINIFLLISKHLDIHNMKLEAAMGYHVMVLLDVIPETLKIPFRFARLRWYYFTSSSTTFLSLVLWLAVAWRNLQTE